MPQLMQLDPIETITKNSFRNFHVKGLDYVCLYRSKELTTKAYFFDNDLVKLPQIVVPHNHAYDFTTIVLQGFVGNLVYREVRTLGRLYDKFTFDSPLKGGDGFKWAGLVRLSDPLETYYKAGTINNFYASPASQIHTLRIGCPGTILLLSQFGNKLGFRDSTLAYKEAMSAVESPSLSGLYDPMPEDRIVAHLKVLRQLGLAI